MKRITFKYPDTSQWCVCNACGKTVDEAWTAKHREEHETHDRSHNLDATAGPRRMASTCYPCQTGQKVGWT